MVQWSLSSSALNPVQMELRAKLWSFTAKKCSQSFLVVT